MTGLPHARVDSSRRAPDREVDRAFLEREIARVGASLAELRGALAFVASDAGVDPRAYEALSPRIRRLVDLVEVAGQNLSQRLCETFRVDAVA